MTPQIGKMLILTGLVAVVLGAVLLLFQRIPLIGKLPGGIVVNRKAFSIHFPIVTCLVISALLTLILNLATYLLRK